AIRAPLVRGIRREKALRRSGLRARRLPRFRARDCRFAQSVAGKILRKLAAHPDVQHGIAFAQFIELRRAGALRSVAAAGISRGSLITSSFVLPPRERSTELSPATQPTKGSGAVSGRATNG